MHALAAGLRGWAGVNRRSRSGRIRLDHNRIRRRPGVIEKRARCHRGLDLGPPPRRLGAGGTARIVRTVGRAPARGGAAGGRPAPAASPGTGPDPSSPSWPSSAPRCRRLPPPAAQRSPRRCRVPRPTPRPDRCSWPAVPPTPRSDDPLPTDADRRNPRRVDPSAQAPLPHPELTCKKIRYRYSTRVRRERANCRWQRGVEPANPAGDRYAGQPAAIAHIVRILSHQGWMT